MDESLKDIHPKPLIYEKCNPNPHTFLRFCPVSSHLTLRSDRSKGDLWLFSWMDAKEGRSCPLCPLQFIFTRDKAAFILMFYWAVLKWPGDDGPTIQMCGEFKGRLCGTAWRRNRKCRGRNKKALGMNSRIEKGMNYILKCELELNNKT